MTPSDRDMSPSDGQPRGRRPLVRWVLASLWVSQLIGCASIGRLTELPAPPQVYGGLQTHVTHFPFGHVAWADAGGDWSGLIAVPGLLTIWWLPVDIVASLAIDTLALPITLPVELHRGADPKAPPCAP